MPAFVLDSSVALAWVLKGERTAQTEALLTQATEHGAYVPGLWPMEVANVLMTYERKSILSAADREQAIAKFNRLPITTDDETAMRVWNTTFDLALAHKLTIYDAGYLELAQRKSLPLATLDKALARAAKTSGVTVMGG